MYIIFRNCIVFWANEGKRTLPWQKTQNPYFIWLREVILQQTRVEQGAVYYHDFITSYPEVHLLAEAPLDEVYKKWEGLGYYSRARNLHFTAKDIVSRLNSEFPRDFHSLLQLKGVGEYTAAAIMSFAYDEPYAVVDGNVYRVLSRFFGIEIPIDTTQGKKYFKELAQKCLDKDQPAIYNQGIIDFGAIICKPKQPLCDHCPLSSHCIAYNQDMIDRLPVKEKKLIKQNRYFNYLVIIDDENVLIEQRMEKDIWQNLYQFPMIESEDRNLEIHELSNVYYSVDDTIQMSDIYKQTLTHRVISARFFIIKKEKIDKCADKQLILKKDIFSYGFPKIIRDYLTEWDNFIY